ncbi:HET-domain-containing protein [Hypomontagnella monticulosa]|nr:HET-domain-containing protein [Hypomontagnella monticulosa]
MALYRYNELPGEDYIRLATIHPGNVDDDIVISFHTTPFLHDECPDYEALSYVWGSEENPPSILVDESEGASTNPTQRAKVLVTQNLVVALRHLRYVDKMRVIWIDALCIDQENRIEKGPYIAMMGAIFRRASRVTAWLGPEENDSSHAMDLINDIASGIEFNYRNYTIHATEGCTDPTVTDVNVPLPINQRDLCSIYHIMAREWFNRLWVRQEIYLANSEAIVLCGPRHVKWTIFRRGIACVMLKARIRFQYSNEMVARTQYLMGFILYSSSTRFMLLRLAFGSSHCRDPRDRLYAIMALLPEYERKIIATPDYTKPYPEIYMDAMRRYIEYYNSVDMLDACELPELAACPSWVPDLSVPSTLREIVGTNYACSQLASWYQQPRPEVLRVNGVFKSKIEQCHQFPQMSYIDGIIGYRKLRQMLLPLRLGRHHTIETIARTLARDMFVDHWDPPRETWPTFDDSEQVVDIVLSNMNINEDAENKDFLSTIINKFIPLISELSGMQLIQGTDGCMGIASKSARPGDEVHVVLGCDSPLLLRPHADGEFLVIGPCFVVGLMYGEAFLGPFSENTRVISTQVEGFSGYFGGYKDNTSGEVVFEDPRLKWLPLDLADFRRNLQKHPGARLTVDPEILRERGVALREYNLV